MPDETPQQQTAPKEKTGAQVTRAVLFSMWGDKPELYDALPASYSTYRAMRKHPTIALTRAFLAAPIIAGSWSVQADDEYAKTDEGQERMKFIADQLIDRRQQIMRSAIFGGIDFGWAPFEKVFEVKEIEGKPRVVLRKLKPLLQDLTSILVEKDTGAFAGFQQEEVKVPLQESLLISFRVEGTYWYGESLLENDRESYNDWHEANAGLTKYEAKAAGSHIVVHFPVGQSEVDGVLTDNGEIAKDILAAIVASGSVTIPSNVKSYVDNLADENPAWKIEILEDKGGRQPTFIDGLKYRDTQIVRGLETPERVLTEGKFGTKAEAGEHKELAITNLENTDELVTQHVNWYVVDQLLALNYGEDARGSVYLVSSPISDAALAYLQQVYDKILSDQATMLEEFPTINTDALKDDLGVPKSEEIAKAGETPPPGADVDDLDDLANTPPDIAEE